MDAQRHFRQMLGEFEIGRRRIHRIAAEDDEHLHAPLGHLLDQCGDLLAMIDRHRTSIGAVY